MCVCAFGSVRLTPNATLTPRANPHYRSVQTEVQSRTQTRRKALLKAEGPENIKHMLVTVETPCFLCYYDTLHVPVHLDRVLHPTIQSRNYVILATPASTHCFHQWLDCKKEGQNCGGRRMEGVCTMCGRRTGDGDLSGPAVCLLFFIAGAHI